MSNGTNYTREQIERAARMYPSAQAAAEGLGLSQGNAFSRICKRMGIKTPGERKQERDA